MDFISGVKKAETLELSEILDGTRTGQRVRVNGAVHTIRHMGDVAFVILRKREGLLQCVYEEGTAGFELKDLKEAAAIEAEGVLEEEERAPGGIEIRMTGVKILSQPSAPMPLAICRSISASSVG